MDYHLVCVRPIGKYKIGDKITNHKEWTKVEGDGHEHSFVRIEIPDDAMGSEAPTSKRSIPR